MQQPFATLLMTRPRMVSESFLRGLDPALLQRVDVIISPLLEIEATGILPDLTGVRGVIFTSSNGVAHGGPGHDLPAYCVGQRTCAEAGDKGWRAELSGPDVAGLIQSLTRQNPPTPLLHISGVHKRADLSTLLSDAGLPTRDVAVYDQIARPLTQEAQAALSGEKPTIVPLFSPRTAAMLAQQAGESVAAHVIGLSKAVLDEVPTQLTATRETAETPDGVAMVSALTNLLRRVEAGDAPQ